MLNIKTTLDQLVRFASVGICSTLISYAAYYILLILLDKHIGSSLSANISYAVGYVIGFFFNYIMTTHFTFKQKANSKNAVGFLGANIINYTLQALLLNLYLSFDMDRKLAFWCVIIIAVPINFCMQKFVFWWAGKNRYKYKIML